MKVIHSSRNILCAEVVITVVVERSACEMPSDEGDIVLLSNSEFSQAT